MNREFEFIHESLPEEEITNTTTKNEHVPYIERNNRILKERARALIRTSPFNNILGRIIIEPIRFVGIYLNQEKLYNGVSEVYYPQNIITGQDLAYYKHCKFRFGPYVEAHEYHKVTNNMEEQTVSGICLVPTINFQRRYKIFSLKTGCVVTHKQKIREIQMPT